MATRSILLYIRVHPRPLSIKNRVSTEIKYEERNHSLLMVATKMYAAQVLKVEPKDLLKPGRLYIPEELKCNVLE